MTTKFYRVRTSGSKRGRAFLFWCSGILGNLTDRLWHGYVVDFLDFHVAGRHWPSFNVADSCICVAAGLLFIAAFRGEPKEKDSGPTEAEDS